MRRATWLTHSVVSRRERPIGPWAFAGVAVASFGGPLALAALIAPGLVADASDSAGVEMLAAVVVFAAPLAIWLRYSRHVAGSGGLYSFVEAAAGRRVALVQAAIWTFSYLLYVIYTTVQIVYDVLPVVLPGERRYQTVLALLIPVALAAVIIAGRAVARARRGTPGRRSRAVTDGHPRGERGGAVLRGRPGARP